MRREMYDGYIRAQKLLQNVLLADGIELDPEFEGVNNRFR